MAELADGDQTPSRRAPTGTREIRFLDGSHPMYILVYTCLAQEVTTYGKEGNPHGSTVGE